MTPEPLRSRILTSTGPTNDLDVVRAEHIVTCVFCREPNAVLLFDCPAEDVLDPQARAIVVAAQRLRDHHQVPTPELLALASGIDLDTILGWAAEVTDQMRSDFAACAPLIRAAALQRRATAFLRTAQDRLIAASPLDVEAIMADVHARLTVLTQPVTVRLPVTIADIIDELDDEPAPWVPIPTGIRVIDSALRGGIRYNQMHLFAGAMKQGKTTLLRNIARHLMRATVTDLAGSEVIERPVRVIHVALDGGNRKAHACDYIAMEAKALCIAAGIDTMVYVDGVTLDSVTGDNIRSYFTARKHGPEWLAVPMRQPVIDAVEQAIAELRALRDNGYFLLYDAESLGYDVDRMMRVFQRHVIQDGFDVLLFDHLGEAGDKRQLRIYERFEQFAQVLGDFLGQHRVAALLLSQRNKRGIADHSKTSAANDVGDSYDPELEGGVSFLKKCDSCWIVSKPDDHRLRVRLHLARRAPQMQVTADTLRLDGPTGLLIAQSFHQQKG